MRKVKPFALIIMIMVLVVTTLTTNVVSAATLERFETIFTEKIPIQQAPNVVIIDTNTEIPSDYQFIMKITEKTNVRLFGSVKGAKTYKTNLAAYPSETVGNPDNVIMAIPLGENEVGSYGVIYENVGVYKGQAIDVKMTIVDYTQWTKADNPYQPHVYINSKHMGINVGGADLKVRYEFTEHDTGKAVKVKGVFSMADIDSYQGLEIFNSPSNPQKIYVPSTSNLKYSKTPNGFGLFSDRFEKDVFVDSENPNHIGLITFDSDTIEMQFYQDREPDTYTPPLRAIKEFTHNGESYKQGSKFEWREIENWKKANPTLKSEEYFIHEEVGYSDINIGASYFEISPYKPVRTAIEAPIKTVIDLDETDVQENTLTNADETFTYRISHFVPAEYAGQVYKSYVFTDDLDDVLEIKNIHVKNEFGTDVTNYFELVKDDATSKITATALASVLQQDNLPIATFYNHAYTFEIDVQIKNGANLDAYLQDDNETAIIPNKASVTVDGVDYESNIVQTKYNTSKQDKTQIIKKVNGQEQVNLENIEDEFTYTIDAKMPNSPETVIISDTLENVLEIVEVNLYNMTDTKDITNVVPAVKGQTVTATFTEKQVQELANKTIQLEIKAKIKKGEDLTGYEEANGHIRIPNVGTFTIGTSTPLESNTVYVTPVYEKVATLVKKSIVDGNQLVEKKEMQVLQGDVDYRIEYMIPVNEAITSILLKDDLEDVLDVKDAMVTIANEEITHYGELHIDHEKEEVVWKINNEKIKEVMGKIISLKVKTTIKDDADLASYLSTDGMTTEIPNIGEISLNNEKPVKSNEVIIASKIDNSDTTPTTPTTPTTTGDKPANVVVTETTPTQTTVTETVEAKVLPQTSESTNWWGYGGLALIIGTLGWLCISKRKTI